MRNNRLHLPSLLVSLSGRLLLLTIFFVMLAEVLIYAPSIGRYRKVYFDERIAAAASPLRDLSGPGIDACGRARRSRTVVFTLRVTASGLAAADLPDSVLLGTAAVLGMADA